MSQNKVTVQKYMDAFAKSDHLVFCDFFDIQNGRIKRLTSCAIEIKK